MRPDQRIKDLCGQLLRAEDISVILTVAAQMKEAIDEYVASKDGEPPVLSEK